MTVYTSHVVLFGKGHFLYILQLIRSNHLCADPDDIETVADPGFPVRGSQPVGGRGDRSPTQVLFGKNVCKNERIGLGPVRGGHVPGTTPRSTNENYRGCASFELAET